MIAFTGDGGLGMTLAEIETAVRLSLRIIVIVFNDAAAAAMGAAGVAVTTGRDLAAALAAALARPGPTVIDASIDPAGDPAVMDLSRGQAGRRTVPGISRARYPKERAQ